MTTNKRFPAIVQIKRLNKHVLGMIIISLGFLQTSLAQTAILKSDTATEKLINNYYALKNALVNSNTGNTATFATAFERSVDALHAETLSREARIALLADAAAIGGSKDLKVQRERFAAVSDKMILLARTVKLSNSPVYVDYCPMKKASWLSGEKAIRNPYYGNAMLSCGSIKSTL